jgi:UDP-N-acetylmuramyl pentapeptide phosphotransferase/UDP-N-acetylglucosamine-1-phosphate transferase
MAAPDTLLSLLPLPATALVIYALLASGLAWRLAVDEPNHRSLHSTVVPRIGGLAMVACLLPLWLISPVPALLTGLAALLAALSFIDDRGGVPVRVRFAVHLAAALCWARWGAGNDSWGVALAAMLAIGWMTNLYNFMDGSNGLAGGMALFGFSAMGWAADANPGLAFAAWSAAAAAAGFLLFNFHPARVFMGDAGSIVLGFLAGALGLAGWQQGLWPLWFPLLAFSPFVVDATVTLLRRGLRGEKVWQAHREHYYQRLVRMGWSHRRTALAEYALMAAVALSALALRAAPPLMQIAGLVLWAVLFLLLMVQVDFRWRRWQAQQGAAA